LFKFSSKSLTSQIILLTVCIAVLPLLFLGWYASWQKNGEISKLNLSYSSALLKSLKQGVKDGELDMPYLNSINFPLNSSFELVLVKDLQTNPLAKIYSFNDNSLKEKELTKEFLKNFSSKEMAELEDFNKNLTLSSWIFLDHNTLLWLKSDKATTLKEIEHNKHKILLFTFFIIVAIMLLAIQSSKFITKPLLSFVDSLKRFSSGEDLCILPGSSSEISLLAREFNYMSDKINTQLRKLKEQSSIIKEQNLNLENEVKERTQNLNEKHNQILSLLNNSGQGFLSCNQSLMIDKEYSKECETFFDLPIANSYLPDKLFTQEDEKESFIKTIKLYFETTNPLRQEAFLSLLETKVNLKNLTISIEYKPINSNSIMLILTDITKICELEDSLNKEKEVVGFITTALKDRRAFFESLDAFDFELSSIQDRMANGSCQIDTFYRKIHTFKGVFSQYSLPNLPTVLHEFESFLAKKELDSSLFSSFIEKTNEAKNKDLQILSFYLGDEFVEQKEVITILPSKLEALNKKIKKLQPFFEKEIEPFNDLLKTLKELELVPLKNLLRAYPLLALNLATKLEKEIEPFEIEGDDFLVDPHKYSGFTKALIHLFNNAVDHGIEKVEERISLNKPASGRLSCKIIKEKEYFTLEISDDGRGLDGKAIMESALEKGLEIPQNISEQELFLLLFNDGFSLKDCVTKISGRGVGLSAIKAEVEALGGEVSISSTLGKGSKFNFKLPYT